MLAFIVRFASRVARPSNHVLLAEGTALRARVSGPAFGRVTTRREGALFFEMPAVSWATCLRVCTPVGIQSSRGHNPLD